MTGYQPPPRWTRDTIIDSLHRYQREKGHRPKSDGWPGASEGYPSKWVVEGRFGSWSKALEAAGMDTTRSRKHWTREDITVAVFRWRYEHGRLPTMRDWKKCGPWWPMNETVRNHFGSWNNMIVSAGYVPVRGTGVRRGAPFKVAA